MEFPIWVKQFDVTFIAADWVVETSFSFILEQNALVKRAGVIVHRPVPVGHLHLSGLL